MWEPVHIFLYGWWPIVHKRNIYEKNHTYGCVHRDRVSGRGESSRISFYVKKRVLTDSISEHQK
ncbi:hypothetical protein [Methanosarcina horonobensis]|uniref:hypothetical protein n=1 Tax=Methanosarcina horonobensis TaxID=418008 RepID=UPI0022B92947|nr:hypothetical protein [Methanosarcina horonobensis]